MFARLYHNRDIFSGHAYVSRTSSLLPRRVMSNEFYTDGINLRRFDAMDAFFTLLLPVIGGMLLLCIGYSYQERPAGVLMIWLGMMSLIGTACWKILEKLT